MREIAVSHSVKKMCQVFGVSRSGYYQWHSRAGKTKRQQANQELIAKIRTIYAQNRKCYGSPRIYRELLQQGLPYGKNRIARLMHENGIYARKPKRYKVTTQSDHDLPIAPNRLARNFTATAPNQAWVSDITYIPTRQGWLYLVIILDLYSRKIVGWAMSSSLQHEFVLSAVKMAVQNRRPARGLILHSDRGVQYACHAYQKLLKKHRIVRSMSRKGDCWDNAPAESFFSTLKQELLLEDGCFLSRLSAQRVIFEFIEVYYNRRRLHSRLNYVSPENYEKRSLCA